MGKYSSAIHKREKPRKKKTHPVWTGVGCLMIIIIPAISIGIGIMLVDYALANGYAVPYQLLGYPQFAPVLYQSEGLRYVIVPIGSINNLYAYAAASLVVTLLLGSLISFIFAFIYRMVGPSPYGPTDAPPPSAKVKKHSR